MKKKMVAYTETDPSYRTKNKELVYVVPYDCGACYGARKNKINKTGSCN